MIFLFPRWDMLIPWRVYQVEYNQPIPAISIFFFTTQLQWAPWTERGTTRQLHGKIARTTKLILGEKKQHCRLGIALKVWTNPSKWKKNNILFKWTNSRTNGPTRYPENTVASPSFHTNGIVPMSSRANVGRSLGYGNRKLAAKWDDRIWFVWTWTEWHRDAKVFERYAKGWSKDHTHRQICLDKVYNSWVRINSEDANLVNCSCFNVWFSNWGFLTQHVLTKTDRQEV